MMRFESDNTQIIYAVLCARDYDVSNMCYLCFRMDKICIYMAFLPCDFFHVPCIGKKKVKKQETVKFSAWLSHPIRAIFKIFF